MAGEGRRGATICSYFHAKIDRSKAEQSALLAMPGLSALNLMQPYSKNQRDDDAEDRLFLSPLIGFTSGGHAKSIELYGAYVVRQIGLSKSSEAGKRLAEVAERYLHGGEQSPSNQTLESLFCFINEACPSIGDEELGFLNRELVKELDACMLSYFSFHWHYAAALLDQVRGGERTLRHVVMTATRKQRVQRVMKTLKTQRVFSTLLDELKAMRGHQVSSVVDEELEAPSSASPISKNPEPQARTPVLLLIGGGMGAGKSTVVKEILQSSFWAGSFHSAVVVEADAFKETDVVYRALSSREHGDVAEVAQLVHQSSTLAASSLLVAALNEGRDVIFDGTMSWEPFVLQTLAMARDIHRRPYRMGAGYNPRDDGVIEERYWEPVHEYVDRNGSQVETASAESSKSEKGCNGRNPYRIEFVAVTCDPQVAVVRGIRRAVSTKRSVPVEGQLRSHKMFASSLEKYCQLVDNVKIYSTSWTGKDPELIGWKNSNNKLTVDVEAFRAVKQLADLNPNAGSVFELYSDVRCNRVWHEVVLSPERAPRQDFLRKELGAVELHRSLSLLSTSSSDMSLSSRSPSSLSLDLSRDSSISDFGSASSLYMSSSIQEQQREQLLQSAR